MYSGKEVSTYAYVLTYLISPWAYFQVNTVIGLIDDKRREEEIQDYR